MKSSGHEVFGSKSDRDAFKLEDGKKTKKTKKAGRK